MSYTAPKRPLKLSEMARVLGVSAAWLRKEAEAGRVTCLQAGDGLLFDAETVEAELLLRLRRGERPRRRPATGGGR